MKYGANDKLVPYVDAQIRPYAPISASTHAAVAAPAGREATHVPPLAAQTAVQFGALGQSSSPPIRQSMPLLPHAQSPPGRCGGSGGGDGGDGGVGGDCGDGGADGAREPQSPQSVPNVQLFHSEPGPPSSQTPSKASRKPQVFSHCDATGVAIPKSSSTVTATRLQRRGDEAPVARFPGLC